MAEWSRALEIYVMLTYASGSNPGWVIAFFFVEIFKCSKKAVYEEIKYLKVSKVVTSFLL